MTFILFSDAALPEPNFISEIENPPQMCVIDEKDGFFFCDKYTQERRIRCYIYQMLCTAKDFLPERCTFKIYEAYRSLACQKALWHAVVIAQQQTHPEMDIQSESFLALCDTYCANPYRQGSGHQSGAAIDVTLCDLTGEEYEMGGLVRGFDKTADFEYPVCEKARYHRLILKTALEKAGFVNYPSEWWHYSFGDRLWARLTGSKRAIFSRLDI